MDKSLYLLRVSELESALLEECSAADIYCICKGKALPENLRAEVWQVRTFVKVFLSLFTSVSHKCWGMEIEDLSSRYLKRCTNFFVMLSCLSV